jgi:osmotically-inducible protein OsmY
MRNGFGSQTDIEETHLTGACCARRLCLRRLGGTGDTAVGRSREANMRSDEDIKRQVEEELRSDPELESADIGVAVKDGVVMLAGFVFNYSDKMQAEADAKRVAGVAGVANDVEIRFLEEERPDPVIARDAVEAIRFEFPQLGEQIRVMVENGWLTLEGEVEWSSGPQRVEQAVRRVRGLKGISNLIQVNPKAESTELKRKIEEVLELTPNLDESNISVKVYSSTVILEGTVPTWWERKEAERAIWSAPGVEKVENHLIIKPAV